MPYFIFWSLYMVPAGMSALWTTVVLTAVLCWDRVGQDQLCWKALNEIPFLGCNQLFSVMPSGFGER